MEYFHAIEANASLKQLQCLYLFITLKKNMNILVILVISTHIWTLNWIHMTNPCPDCLGIFRTTGKLENYTCKLEVVNPTYDSYYSIALILNSIELCQGTWILHTGNLMITQMKLQKIISKIEKFSGQS